MIKLENINHIYASKKGGEVNALNDVSLTFANKGMYFLTGKSGSGKSTLLNLLSGIDFLQQGEILIDEQPMSKFSAKDYDNYRNNYAGVIFQEFNLIESMTVFENIDMPLKLQGKTNNEAIIAECLKKVDLEGYENRFPSELSGGQRQRISIARQLAKGSKIILADEPTGSLDSENSDNIFKLLKELSKDTLIVVASHDLEFAQTYGDAIVKLVDGKVTDVQPKDCAESLPQAQKLKKTKNRFPNRYAVRMAFKDILHTKVRFLVAAFLCFVSLAMFAMFVTISSFSSEKALANTVVNRNEKFISAGAAKLNNDGEINSKDVEFNRAFTLKQMNYVESNYDSSNYVKQTVIENRFFVYSSELSSKLCPGNNFVAVIDSPDDVKVYGYELASGYLPLTDDSVYITDYYAHVIISAKYCYIENGLYVPLDENASVYSLVGKTIANEEQPTQYITVAGIINTDYMRFMPKLDEYENGYEFAEYYYLSTTVYASLFATQGYVNAHRNRINMWDVSIPCFSLYFNDEYQYVSTICDVHQIVQNDLVIFADSHTINGEEITLAKNQIIIALTVYNQIFGENKQKDYYYDIYQDKVNHYPTHIGEKVKLELFDGLDGIRIDGMDEVEIVGVYFDAIFDISTEVFVSAEDYAQLLQDTEQYHKIDFAVEKNRSFTANSFTKLRNEKILMSNFYSSSIYDMENSFSTFNAIFVIVGSILLVFSVVIFANFISVAILNRKKDVGIIRAIGGSEGNVFKIFFIEGLIFVAIVSVLTLIVSFVMAAVMNGILVKGFVSGTLLLVFNPWNVLAIPAACFVVMMLATFYPIRKISKRSPVEIIRSN